MIDLAFLKKKVQISLASSFKVIAKPSYLFLSLAVGFVFFELTYWAFNLNILSKILTSSNVTIPEKLRVLTSPIEAISKTDGEFQVGLMLVLSLIQGVVISLLIYAIKHQRKVDSDLVGGSAFVSFLAVIGLGCPSCGTSLITPVVAIFVSGSATALAEDIATVVLPFSILVSLFALYVLGLRLSAIDDANNPKIIKTKKSN